MKAITGYISALCLGTALATTAALADSETSSNPGWYWGLSGDYSWMHSDNGGGGNAALGYRFWPTDFGNFRAEAEGGYHDLSPDHYFTYMGNLYYDFNGLHSYWPAVTPYVGAGAGDATVHFSESDPSGRYSGNDNVFAYQFMAGLTFNVSPTTDWSVGYRYLASDNADITDNAGVGLKESLNANNVELALRYHF